MRSSAAGSGRSGPPRGWEMWRPRAWEWQVIRCWARPVELAGGEGYLFTGRLSVRSHPWLADHAVAGTVLLPGTAFVELAIRAGDAAGCGRLAELTLEAPLLLPPESGIQLQVAVGGPGEDGQRTVGMYARPEDAGPGTDWTRHASGLLAPAAAPEANLAADFTVWPAAGSRLDRYREPVREPGRRSVRVRAGVPRAAGGVATRA